MAGRVLRFPSGRRALASFALAAALAPAAALAAPYPRGQAIEITGEVVDGDGVPVPDAHVSLIAAHLGFELRSLRRVEEGHVRVRARSDEHGRFRLEWRWDPYYDRFRVRVERSETTAAAIQPPDLPENVLTEIDISRRIVQGTPVMVPLSLAGPARRREPAERVAAAAPPDAPARPAPQPRAAPAPPPAASEPAVATTPATTAVTAPPPSAPSDAQSPRGAPAASSPGPAPTPPPRAATAPPPPSADRASGGESADQRRVYEQMGKPDRVDRLELEGGDEVAWWYFEQGRSFHFRAGRLLQVMEFEPVKSF